MVRLPVTLPHTNFRNTARHNALFTIDLAEQLGGAGVTQRPAPGGVNGDHHHPLFDLSVEVG
jgi:hypothetical protein